MILSSVISVSGVHRVSSVRQLKTHRFLLTNCNMNKMLNNIWWKLNDNWCEVDAILVLLSPKRCFLLHDCDWSIKIMKVSRQIFKKNRDQNVIVISQPISSCWFIPMVSVRSLNTSYLSISIDSVVSFLCFVFVCAFAWYSVE